MQLTKVNIGGDLSSIQNFRGGLQRARMEAQQGGGSLGGKALLKMTKGEWVYGQDAMEVEEGSLWAINPTTLQHGWIAWHDGSIWKEIMEPITNPIPMKEELPEVPPPSDPDEGQDEWMSQFSAEMVCLTGEDVGTEVIFKTSTAGGGEAMGNVFALIDRQLDDDPERLIPIVQLETTSYLHKIKKYGRIYKPVFKLAGSKWMSMDEAANVGEAGQQALEAPEETEPEPPKRAQKTKSEEAPAPTRRRRRKKAAA